MIESVSMIKILKKKLSDLELVKARTNLEELQLSRLILDYCKLIYQLTGDKVEPVNNNVETVKAFLEEHNVKGVPIAEAYEEYKKFCRLAGEPALNKMMFAKAVKNNLNVVSYCVRINGQTMKIFKEVEESVEQA